MPVNLALQHTAGTGMPVRDVLWITWEEHARTRNIASYLGVTLREIVTRKKGLTRYLVALARTFSSLVAVRPKVVMVQNPSMILTGFVLVLRPLLRYRVVVDAHNEAVEPYVHDDRFSLWLANRYLRYADLTIVTNPMMAKVVSMAGGRAVILPDRIPDYGGKQAASQHEKPVVVMIATYAADEPVEEFLEAVGQLDGRVEVYVTGRAEKLRAEVRDSVGPHVHFTGFLEEHEYWELLGDADGIVDLTKKDNCLVCGAYEGVAVGKPLILSDNAATRALFSKGVLYVDNTAAGIRAALEALLENGPELQQQVIVLRDELRARWLVEAGHVSSALVALAQNSAAGAAS